MSKMDPQFPRFGSPRYRIQKGAATIFIVIIAVALIAAGFGVSLATRAWDPVWNPFRPDPADVLEKTMSNMKNVESLHQETNITLSAESFLRGGQNYDVILSLSGDSSETKADFGLNFSMTGPAAVPGENTSLSLFIRIRKIGEEEYFKVESLDFPQEMSLLFMMIGLEPSSLKNQWIKYNQEHFSESFPGPFPGQQENIQSSQLQEIIAETKLYNIKEELSDETVDGKKAYHYVLALDEEGVKKLMVELSGSMGAPSGFEEDILKGVDNFFEKTGEITMDFWIGKKDNLLYKVSGEKEIVEDEGIGNVVLDMKFSDFNKPLTIEVPKEFVTFDELIQPPSLETLFSPTSDSSLQY